MASDITVNLTVKTEDAARQLEDFAEDLNEVGKTASRSAKDANKDWGGVADLFSGLLPRNIQGLLRSFKSTERGVKRVSRSFKALKAAWASIGIGLIILALEALVENWDAVAEALGFVDAEAEKNAKLTAEQDKAVQQLTTSTSGYIAVLENEAATEAQRAEALAALNKEFNNIIDLEADAATQIEQANAALKVKEDLERARIKQQQTLAEFQEKDLAAQDQTQSGLLEQKTFWESLQETQVRVNAEQAEADAANKEATAELAAAQAAYNALVGESAERTKERAEAERAAEQASKRAIADAEKREKQRLQFLDDLKIFEQELGKEGEELETMRLKRQQKAEMDRAKSAELSNEGLERLQAKHNEQLTELQDGYNETRAEKEKDALERIESATLSQDQRQRKQVNKQYDELIKLAEEYGVDTVALEKARQDDLAAIPNKQLEQQTRLQEELRKMFMTDAEVSLIDAQQAFEERMLVAKGNEEVFLMNAQQAFEERMLVAKGNEEVSLIDAQQAFEERMLDAKGNEELELLALQAFEADKATIAKDGAELELLALRAFEADKAAIAKDGAELELLALRAFEADKAAIAKEGADAQIKEDERVLQSKINLVDNLNSVIGQYQDLVEETTQAEVNAARERDATDKEIQRIEEQGAERAKRLAITQVLISQATAIADGIAAAVKAGKDAGPAAPFVIAGYIAGIVGSIVAAFSQVKGLMNQAQASGATSVASSPVQVTPLIPQQNQNEFTSENEDRNFKAFVVQSELQGQTERLGRIEQRASL